MLHKKSCFQKLVMTKEELKSEIIGDFTQTLISEVKKQVELEGKEEYIKGLE